jgi:hypothetical protein
MGPELSALIVAVPEAEPAVAHLRARLDRSASWGVPAHITLITGRRESGTWRTVGRFPLAPVPPVAATGGGERPGCRTGELPPNPRPWR